LDKGYIKSLVKEAKF